MSISEQLARQQEIKASYAREALAKKQEITSLTEGLSVPLIEQSALSLGKKGLSKVLNKIGVKSSNVEDLMDIGDKIKKGDISGLINKAKDKLSENDTVKGLQAKQENIKANINNLQNKQTDILKNTGDDGTQGIELDDLDTEPFPEPPEAPTQEFTERQNFNMRRDLLDDDADPFQPSQGQPVYSEVKVNGMSKIQPTGTQEGSTTESPTVEQPSGIQEPSSAVSTAMPKIQAKQ
jgi:hypothetical protein